MQIAILGLSSTGKLIAEKLLASGHDLVIWNNSKEPLEELRTEKAEYIVNQKLTLVHSLDEFQNLLRKPRVLWSALPSGEPTETLMGQLGQFVEAGDIIVDSGNSHFKDTERHFNEFEKRGVKFLGIGVAGGAHALENGCCLMVGGNPDAYQYIVPILDSLASPNGIHVNFGPGGAGHFVNMVHSGIQSGIEQAIAEGIGILHKSDYQLDPADVANTWQGGGVISSFLLDMVIDALNNDPNLSQFNGQVNVLGMSKWAAEQAKATNVPSGVIEQSVAFREKSLYDKAVQDTVVAKVTQAMEKEIGG